MINVLATTIPTGPIQESCGPQVSATRNRQIARKRHLIDRLRSRVADALLLELSGGRPHHYSDQGQPLAADPHIHLSATHDGRWVLAASGPRAVGIDVDDMRRIDSSGFHHLLNPDELLAIEASVPPEDRLLRLASIWAAKEAYVKSEGVGLALDPRLLHVDYTDPPRALVRRGSRARPVEIRQVDEDHVIAITSEHSTEFTLRIATQVLPSFPETSEERAKCEK